MAAEGVKKFADAALQVPCTPESFVRIWFELLRIRHRLTTREMDVAAALVKKWFILRESTTDDLVLNKTLFSKETKREICADLGITEAHFRTVFQQLKINGIVENGRLNPQYIPKYKKGTPFRLVFIISDAGGIRKDN